LSFAQTISRLAGSRYSPVIVIAIGVVSCGCVYQRLDSAIIVVKAAEYQFEHIKHQAVSLPRLFPASMPNRIFGTHSRVKQD
jgi:hypothetical protein